jgi:hypothetical protein
MPRDLDPRIAVIGVAAEDAVRPTIAVEITAGEDAEFLENDVLDHAAMTLGHHKHVRRFA